jgi:phage shock protein C
MNWHQSSEGRRSCGFNGLRRIPSKGRISGICAGIAAHWGVNLTWVRVFAVVALIFAPMFTLIAYGLGTFLLKPVEETPTETKAAAKDDWASGDLPPDLNFTSLRRKFRDLEERAGAMETQVTSREFHLRRDFKQMGEA